MDSCSRRSLLIPSFAAIFVNIAAASPAYAAQDDNPYATMMTAPLPDVKKDGDEQLTCEQLKAETAALNAEVEKASAEMNRIATSQIQGTMAKQQASGVATQALSGIASALLPGAGALLGAGIKAATKAQKSDPAAAIMEKMQPFVERQAYAAERMRHVQMLYADKCAVAAPATPTQSPPSGQ